MLKLKYMIRTVCKCACVECKTDKDLMWVRRYIGHEGAGDMGWLPIEDLTLCKACVEKINEKEEGKWKEKNLSEL